MQRWACRISALAVATLLASCISAAAAAELADYVLANGSGHAGARRIEAQALIELGERQINAIARNYYMSSAMYLLRDLPPPP